MQTYHLLQLFLDLSAELLPRQGWGGGVAQSVPQPDIVANLPVEGANNVWQH